MTARTLFFKKEKMKMILEEITDKNFQDIEIDLIFVNATPGAHLKKCLAESIILSALTQKSVTLTHNERYYKLNYDDMWKCIEYPKNHEL